MNVKKNSGFAYYKVDSMFLITSRNVMGLMLINVTVCCKKVQVINVTKSTRNYASTGFSYI